MLPYEWQPLETETVRVGSYFDGGYVVSPAAVAGATLLISMGINDDWTFEEGFRRLNRVPMLCFDHTVGFRLWARAFLRGLIKRRPRDMVKYLSYRRFFRGEVEHRKQAVGYDADGGVSLASILAETDSNDLFLKADIEGAEYRILETITAHSERFAGITMELHFVDLHRDRITDWIRSLPNHAVTALHPNNFGGVDERGDPLTVEITLTRLDLVGARTSAPPLHRVNNPNGPVIKLRFERPLVVLTRIRRA
ncbi:MAG TPA: hypothetical protein VFF48_04200 [Brevundimonas sp.]|nr:hypothetical protein [Brevundimonas sp.]